MSTTKTHQTVTYSCSGPDCDTEFEPHEAVDGSYCSRECSLRDDGRDYLDNIKHDHRWCFGCFRRLKEIEKPPADTPEFVVGFQYQTEHARHGEKEGRAHIETRDELVRRRVESADHAPDLADSLVMTGTICECGTTDHRDDYLREGRIESASEATTRLLRVLEWMGHEGQHDKTVDARTLVQTLTQSVRERQELDWALAVGRAMD